MSHCGAVVTQGVEAAFSKAELDSRVHAARKILAENAIDIFIITSPENIGRALAGTTGTLVTNEEAGMEPMNSGSSA